ncbi:hypothetical protein RvY_02467 [Ramazzottius varieornatus]|uniref:Polyketide synthase C-terminal extension domain-containing protein n=1 Tax=Ramazzottius varieornatus TaxID=947166 RepID=A0A1D1UUC4_RAMVA|nr:hypothetical protein RvY_02467 [Ramazzottius varieornatus]
MQTGIIPPNLHYNNPNPRIPALIDGRLQVVTEPTRWTATLAGQNCFGFGGQNAHHVLMGNPRVMEKGIEVAESLLIVCMGRTEQAAHHAMDFIKKFPKNPYVPYLLMQSTFVKPASMP